MNKLKYKKEAKEAQLYLLGVRKKCYNCEHWDRKSKPNNDEHKICKKISEIENCEMISAEFYNCEHFNYMNELLGG